METNLLPDKELNLFELRTEVGEPVFQTGYKKFTTRNLLKTGLKPVRMIEVRTKDSGGLLLMARAKVSLGYNLKWVKVGTIKNSEYLSQ